MMSGDKWRLAGRDASLDLPRRREAGATLLEECMLGPERMNVQRGENEARRS